MKLYWSYKSIPELKHLPESEQRKIFSYYWKRLPRTWQFWLFFIPFIAIMIILEWVYSSYGVLAAFLGLLILVLIKWQIIMTITRSMIKAHFREGRHIIDG